MKTIIHKANERGQADHGWLHAKHSFSFASYYNPEKVHFGMLRVLNDDIVEPGMGFGSHPHDNMEIITIILEGALEHKDNMGNGSVIRPGDVQVMSAGTGVMHSEFNPSETERVNLFQLWIFPKEKNVKPRYDQRFFEEPLKQNQLLKVVSGNKQDDALYIHQDAAISLGKLDTGKVIHYSLSMPGNGAYIMVISGEIVVDGNSLNQRDAIGVWDAESIEITAKAASSVMVVEVPMN